jgi:hypothetical protein
MFRILLTKVLHDEKSAHYFSVQNSSRVKIILKFFSSKLITVIPLVSKVSRATSKAVMA